MTSYFPKDEYELRWRRVHDEMQRRGIETAVVWGKTAATFDRAGDILYLANFFAGTVGHAFDTTTHRARAFSAVVLKIGETPELHADDPELRPDRVATDRYAVHADPVRGVADSLREREIKGRVAFCGSDFFPQKYWERFEALTPFIDWVMADDLVRTVRRVKTPRELDCFREGAEIVNPALERLMGALISGKSEAEAAAGAIYEIARRGGNYHKISCTHGDTIDVTCRDSLTGYSLDAPNPGDLVRAFIIGPIFQGYYFDPGRTAVAGARPDRAQRELIEGCAEIVDRIGAAIRPAVAFKEVATIGDELVRAFGSDGGGLGARYPFYGHPNGLYFEAPPYISNTFDHLDARFEEGMVLGVEAFVGCKGVGSAGFEQNVIVGADGLELLTTTPMLFH